MIGPLDPVGNGRDSSGRFIVGNRCSHGRRPRPSIYRIALEHAEAEGLDLEHALWLVAKKLIEMAQAGDTTAARIVLDELCLPASDELERLLERLERDGV